MTRQPQRYDPSHRSIARALWVIATCSAVMTGTFLLHYSKLVRVWLGWA